MARSDTIDLDRDVSAEGADLHQQALDRYDTAFAREEQNILEGLEDLRMLANEQWDEILKAQREEAGRPCMTENRLPQFVRQITGDIRQMRPSIKAVGVNSKADPETAEVIEGMFRYIENRSMASAVYFQAADSQVAAGRGALRVTTEYASDSTMEQEIRIAPIEDGLSVLFDPDAILPCKTDATYCFVPVDMSLAGFRKKYPEASASDFGDQSSRMFTGWYGEDFIRVAEYWFKAPIERTFLVANGQMKDITDTDPDTVREAEEMVALAKSKGIEISIEKREGYKVRRAMMTGSEIIEGPTDWPGRHIPIVPFEGEEIRIGRRVMRHGAIRNARDTQRRFNYFITAQAEAIALQPKAPWLLTEVNVEGYEDQWERANSDNRPYLTYTPDPLNDKRPPQRIAPAIAAQGIEEGINLAAQGLQATTGIYNSGLGASSNETSGKAIQARQREGDTGTYVYTEHFGQALQQTGVIVVDLIPHIYDTTRELRIIGDDGSEKLVEINKPAGLAMSDDGEDPDTAAATRIQNDVTLGAYNVVISMGPSYNTRREEAREGLLAFLQTCPQLAPVLLDLVAKMQDWPLADEVRERLEMMLPPEIKAAIAEKRGDPPEPPAPPPQPNPMQQAAMAQQQAEQEREAQLAGMKHQVEVGKLTVAQQKINAEIQRSEADVQSMQIDAAARMHEADAGVHVAAHTARGAAAAAQPVADPRVDQLVEAFGAMREMLMQIAQAVTGGQGAPQAAPPPPDPSMMPGAPPAGALPAPYDPSQPAPAGFSLPAPDAGPAGFPT